MTLDLFSGGLLSSAAFSEATAFGLAPAASTPALRAAQPSQTPPPVPSEPHKMPAGHDFRIDGDRQLASGWKARAADNIAAIRLAAEIEAAGRPATSNEQLRLARFIGFGATALANNLFRRPGEADFRPDWSTSGAELEALVTADDYASLARCTQYAHFTPETIVRALWAGLLRLGFRGGQVLEPGIGSGMFPALLPVELTGKVHFTGVELDPVTARIARLLQPSARIIAGDFTRAALPQKTWPSTCR